MLTAKAQGVPTLLASIEWEMNLFLYILSEVMSWHYGKVEDAQDDLHPSVITIEKMGIIQ